MPASGRKRPPQRRPGGGSSPIRPAVISKAGSGRRTSGGSGGYNGGGRGRGRRSGPLGRRPLLPIAGLLLLIAVGVGAYLVLDARSSRAAEQDLVSRYAKAWAAQDFAAMYREIDDDARGRVSEKRFTMLNREALDTATSQRVVPGDITRVEDDRFRLPVAVRTRLFGNLSGTVPITLVGKGDQARVRWTRSMTFPGLRGDEKLARTTELPPRATILARDGTTPLAEGSNRTSTVPNIANEVVGAVGPAKPEDAALMRRLGVPSGATVGISGLERILNPQLIGQPGGTLKAGDRTLRRVPPRKAPAVRSSISLAVVKAAAEAQRTAPDASGTTVINSRTGEVLGFQGSAWTSLQPPGSTMKIITAAAALEDGVAKTSTVYPKETEAAGYGIQNSNEELCGGTLVESFAHSCNSVFVPMGAKLGPKRFVEMAEKFGFNRPPGVPGASISSLPEASQMDVREAAESAIGQARVQATSLQIALMTATIANGGREPELTFLQSSKPAKTRRVVSRKTASEMRQLMVAVISEGTGKSARVALPGITTAGKTGTAELAATQGAQCDQQAQDQSGTEGDSETPDPPSACGNADGKSTTAWMSAFAPATASGSQAPIAIGVLRARDFQGGATAAPVASKVLTAALN